MFGGITSPALPLHRVMHTFLNRHSSAENCVPTWRAGGLTDERKWVSKLEYIPYMVSGHPDPPTLNKRPCHPRTHLDEHVLGTLSLHGFETFVHTQLEKHFPGLAREGHDQQTIQVTVGKKKRSCSQLSSAAMGVVGTPP
jgi:hypothetical protein